MQHSASCTVKRFLAVQQRSADWSSEVVEIHDVPPTLSQYVIQGLKPGHIYIFQVRAVNLGRIAFSHRTSSSHSFSSSCRFFLRLPAWVRRNKYGMGIWSDSSIPVRTMDGATPSQIEDLRASEIYQSFIRLQCSGIINL